MVEPWMAALPKVSLGYLPDLVDDLILLIKVEMMDVVLSLFLHATACRVGKATHATRAACSLLQPVEQMTSFRIRNQDQVSWD